MIMVRLRQKAQTLPRSLQKVHYLPKYKWKDVNMFSYWLSCKLSKSFLSKRNSPPKIVIRGSCWAAWPLRFVTSSPPLAVNVSGQNVRIVGWYLKKFRSLDGMMSPIGDPGCWAWTKMTPHDAECLQSSEKISNFKSVMLRLLFFVLCFL